MRILPTRAEAEKQVISVTEGFVQEAAPSRACGGQLGPGERL